MPERDRDALPYDVASLAAADQGWRRLCTSGERADASLAALTAFEEHVQREDPALLARLYPYAPAYVLQRRELDDLFDTYGAAQNDLVFKIASDIGADQTSEIDRMQTMLREMMFGSAGSR